MNRSITLETTTNNGLLFLRRVMQLHVSTTPVCPRHVAVLSLAPVRRQCNTHRRTAFQCNATAQPLIRSGEAVSIRNYKVRKMDDSVEVPVVADIQAQGFAELLPLPLVQQLQLASFKAEVLDALRKKVKTCDADSFAVLVVESAQEPGPVGVVEVSLEDDKEVLVQLQGTGLYAYISCMAVLPRSRRKGVASALLAAAEKLVGRWGQSTLVLHVYEDNTDAVALYKKNGFVVVGSDPGWKRLLPGARVRLLMQKQL